MNFKLLLLILLVLVYILMIGVKVSRGVDTFFGVPLLFNYRSDCDSTYNSSNMNYSFYIASQITQPTTLTFETISAGKSLQFQQIFHLGKSYTSLFEMTANEAETYAEMYSLAYSCKNEVFGTNFFFQGNPTISVIAFFAGLAFNQSFAMYPVCIDDMSCTSSARAQYHYYVLFGLAYGRENTSFLDGITIQMHQKTEITIQLSGAAHALNNTVEEPINQQFSIKDQGNIYTTLWIEPKISTCDNVNPRSLEETTIVSNKPITVFTNKARCGGTVEFSYESQVVHQMPEVKDWGKTFIIDTQQINILPKSMRSDVDYELSIRAAQKGTIVKITYYQFNQPPQIATDVLKTSNVYRVAHSASLMLGTSHIAIKASDPILVLYTIYSQHASVHHSVLLQPVEWFSNKQTIVLQHPTNNEVYQYHISVVAPKKHYNPVDVQVTEGKDLCQSIPVLNYKGFVSSTAESFGYVVFYIDLNIIGGTDNVTQLLIWHRNTDVQIGTTVFAYAGDLQYAYSNGYTLKSGVDEIQDCKTNPQQKRKRMPVHMSSGLLTAGLFCTSICLLSACCYQCREKKRKHPVRINRDEEMQLSEESYRYDGLLLFADEDSRFVKYTIYQPLIKEGYKLLWKHDPTSNIFSPGKSVIQSMQCAVEVCRIVVLICTKHFGTELDQEVAYCIDIQNSQGMRRMVPVAIEDECQLASQLKRYTQIRIKTRNLNHVEHINLVSKLKKDLGRPIQS